MVLNLGAKVQKKSHICKKNRPFERFFFVAFSFLSPMGHDYLINQIFSRQHSANLAAHLFSHTAIYLGEHPAIEMLVSFAICREAGTVLRVLLLPDARLGDIFFAELLRMIAYALYIMRHTLRRLDHLAVAGRTVRPRTFVNAHQIEFVPDT